MSDRESSQVGYRLRGIEPPDLARYPDPVKLMFQGWVVDFGLTAKDRDLAAGLGADGTPLRPLLPKASSTVSPRWDRRTSKPHR